ncbi:DUF1810 domain-containing protein [Cereibacter changlensis JA139]|uniref:DUF1810 domain-containing protein n=2 Tax=Cereibacter changlensis TaxID=402884 RepID=A0A2T4JYZ6_9RHOB|nr:DUF1810 domain-containing protein [Cereibacter changlensis]PTE23124.1 DUF1810 domain-containing protein [Cereibacter changlensis JA139]PZX49235.1 uncharacterized protein (DUF1810 family) [Cereibacter changlensis]
MSGNDPHDLQRFVKAQWTAYEAAMTELQAGRKQGHWMWFVFPQLRGLGRSETAQRFGLASLEEARAYIAHPMLGRRLELATETVLSRDPASVTDMFGTPDDLKFHSCMSLFAQADPGPYTPFRMALGRWFDGRPDAGTARLLGL